MMMQLENIISSQQLLYKMKAEYKDVVEKLTEVKSTRDERNSIKNKADKVEEEIRRQHKHIDACNNILKRLTVLNDKVNRAHDNWIDNSLLLFRKAAVVRVKIILHPDGYELLNDNKYPGLYSSSRIREKSDKPYFQSAKAGVNIISDLKTQINKVYPVWKAYFDANQEFWDYVNGEVKNGVLVKYNPDYSAEDYTEDFQEYLKSEDAKLKNLVENKAKFNIGKYGDIDKAVQQLDADKLRREKEIYALAEKIDTMQKKLAETDPVVANFSIPSSVKSRAYDSQWLDIVKKVAAERKQLPYIPCKNGAYYRWQDSGVANVMMPSGDTGIKSLQVFISTLFLAFPVRKIHITVIDKLKVPQFFRDLSPNTCSIIYKEEDIRQYIYQLEDVFHRSTSTPDIPQEVVVLIGYDHENFAHTMDSLKNILRNGRQSGIYFLAVPTSDYSEDADSYRKSFRKEIYEGNISLLSAYAMVELMDDTVKNGNKPAVKQVSANWEKLVTAYVNKYATSIENVVYAPISSGELYKSSPIKDLVTEQLHSDVNQIVVPFARSLEGDEMQLRFATSDHISTFIIGRSGSGKSYLLHSILTNLLLKYDPTTVDLILMDFKMGGVELNYYKDVPHVSKLLVNGSDKQIVREIMTAIDKEMTKRGEILSNSGESNIDGYNDYARKRGIPLMRHIILLVDECQGLFEDSINYNSREEIQKVVENIARQGRNQGVHLVFATQLYHGSGIPNAAIKQFTDFLLMNCTPEDAADCGINNTTVKKCVSALNKGEVIHYSNNSFQRGFVYDYAGANGEYKEQTAKVLHTNKRYSSVRESQFYFNASQLYYFGKLDLNNIEERAERSTMPVSVLGRNLSVRGDAMMIKFAKEEGNNLLIIGYNRELQAERILWHSVLSLVYSHKCIGKSARFKIFSTFRDDEQEEGDIKQYVSCRYAMLHKLRMLQKVDWVMEDERNEVLEEIGMLIRRRMAGESKDETVYLVLPNQDLYRKNLRKPLKGQGGFDINNCKSEKASSMSFELPKGFGTASSPGFIGVDTVEGLPSTKKTFGGACGSSSTNLEEELNFILANGPEQRVHVIIQAPSADKILATENLRASKMQELFYNIVMLKMGGTAAIGLPVEEKRVTQLTSEVKRMRAIVYNPDDGIRTFVPYDFPGGDNSVMKQEDIMGYIINKCK